MPRLQNLQNAKVVVSGYTDNLPVGPTLEQAGIKKQHQPQAQALRSPSIPLAVADIAALPLIRAPPQTVIFAPEIS